MDLSTLFSGVTNDIHRAAAFLALLLSGTNKSVHDLEASDPLIAAGIQLAEREVPGLAQAAGIEQAVLTTAQAIATATVAAVPAPAAGATADSGAVKLGGMVPWLSQGRVPRAVVAGAALLALSSLVGCATAPVVLGAIGGIAGAVASDTTGTTSSIASAVSTDATAAADATPDVASLVSTIQGIVADGTVTPAQMGTVDTALSDLSSIAATVTPTSSGSTISTALGGIEGVIGKLAPIFSDLAPLIALAENDHRQGGAGFAVMAETVQPTKVQHSDAAKIAALMKHLKHAKAIAAAKLAAGK